MRKAKAVIAIILIIILVVLGVVLFRYAIEHKKLPVAVDIRTLLKEAKPKRRLPFVPGEQLTYDVFLKGLRLGSSVLTFHGETELNGRKCYHITFHTDVKAFNDKEEIYADRETFLPVRVERSIQQFGTFPYTIQEEYDQELFKVDIHKQGKVFSKNTTIQREAPIYNPILLPYYYRIQPVIREGERKEITLPLLEFEVVLVGEDTLAIEIGEYVAYIFDSVPSKFKFWLSADERRIPLKIEGLGPLGYSLIIKEIGQVGEERLVVE